VRRVYHYTTHSGLLGILDSRELWATHYKFLNDASEISYFQGEVINIILPVVHQRIADSGMAPKGGLEAFAEKQARIIVQNALQAMEEEIYITSFYGEHGEEDVNRNGLLSLWRGYGGDGGYALVFRAEGLEALMKEEMDRHGGYYHLTELIYGNDTQKVEQEISPLLRGDFADYARLMIDVALGKADSRLPLDSARAYNAFLQAITRCKHPSFREEREVRLVVCPTYSPNRAVTVPLADKARHFRPNKQGQGDAVPYLKLFENCRSLPIERIIVGPHKDKALRAAALKVRLRNTDVKVSVSDIPYVGH